MKNDVGRRRGRQLQDTEKLQIHQTKCSGCQNKEIGAPLKVIRTIQRVKVPPSVDTAVQVKKRQSPWTRTTESQRAVARTLVEERYRGN